MLSGLARRSGQAMIGAMFIKLGFDAAREPGMRVKAAEALGVGDPEMLVRLNGGAMVAGGLALVTDTVPRLAASGLIASLIPTTVTGHAFWKADDAQRGMQQIQFLKNVAIVGGLLAVIAAND